MAEGNITIQVEAKGAEAVKSQLAEIRGAVEDVEKGMQAVGSEAESAAAGMQGAAGASADAKTQIDGAASSASQTARNVQNVKTAAEGAASSASKMATEMERAKTASQGVAVGGGLSGAGNAAAAAAAGTKGINGIITRVVNTVNSIIGPFSRLIGVFVRLAGVIGLIITVVGVLVNAAKSLSSSARTLEAEYDAVRRRERVAREARAKADELRIEGESVRQLHNDNYDRGQRIASMKTREELDDEESSVLARRKEIQRQLALLPAEEFRSVDERLRARLLEEEQRWLDSFVHQIGVRRLENLPSSREMNREFDFAETLDDLQSADSSAAIKSMIEQFRSAQRTLQREWDFGLYNGDKDEWEKEMNEIARKIAAASERLAAVKQEEIKDAMKSGEQARAAQDKAAQYEEATLAERRKILAETRKELEEQRAKAVENNDSDAVSEIERALTELHAKEIALARDEDRENNKQLTWSVGESTNRYARIGLMRGSPNITGIEQTAKNTQRIADDVAEIKDKINEDDASDSVAVFSA